MDRSTRAKRKVEQELRFGPATRMDCSRDAVAARRGLIAGETQLVWGMPLSEPLRARFQDLITTNKVVLFMKGTRAAPACGFSAAVVGNSLDYFGAHLRDGERAVGPGGARRY